MGEKVDDEISLEEVLSNNMARVAPVSHYSCIIICLIIMAV